MPRFQAKRYEQILMQMIAKVIARTNLSDISDSSVLKHILAAAAIQDDEQYFQMSLLLKLFSIDTATGEDLDERAKEIQPGLISRYAAMKASGNVVFSRNGTTGSVVISTGTKVKTGLGLVFTTTVDGGISPTSPEQVPGHGVGRDSGLIPVVADAPGVAGNVVTGTVVKFVQKPIGVDEVTNLIAFFYGADKESDDSFRGRIKAFISALARSTVTALESGVLGVVDETTGASILFSKAVEDSVDRGLVVLYVDDGTGSVESSEAITGEILTAGLSPGDVAVGGEEVLHFDFKPIKSSAPVVVTSSTRGVLSGGNTYSGSYTYWYNEASGQINFSPPLTTGEQITADYLHYTGLIALAQKVVDGDLTDPTSYPGIRAAGVLVIVRTPQVLIQSIEVNITTTEGYDYADVKVAVKEAIKGYVNTLGISGDLQVATLYQKVMGTSGVFNCTIVDPPADVILLDDQLARTTDINITVN